MENTAFDSYLEGQLKDPAFKKIFEEEYAAIMDRHPVPTYVFIALLVVVCLAVAEFVK